MSLSPPKAYPQSVSGASLSSGLALPIPARFPGFRLGSPTAPVLVELFIDLQCPYSAKAYATLLAVHQRLPSSLCLQLIPLCLPTHRQAYHMLKSSLAAALRGAELASSPTPSAAASATWAKYASFLYAQVDRFSHASHYENKTGGDLIDHCARCVVEFFKEEEDRFDVYHAQLSKGEELDGWAKESMRLATKRGVTTTPTSFVNGVQAALLDSSTSEDAWVDLIQTLEKQGGVMA